MNRHTQSTPRCLFAEPVRSEEPETTDLQFVFPVRDKARGKAALLHLQSVTALSRLTWKAIQAETDDNREWLPGPQQKDGVFRVAITAKMIKAWHQALDDTDDLLAGKN